MNEIPWSIIASSLIPFTLVLACWYGLRRIISENITRGLVLCWWRTRVWLFHRGFAWLRPIVAWLVSWLYLILPVDLVPDLILGVGWLDDALLTLLLQIWWIRDWLACDPEQEAHIEKTPWFKTLFHLLGFGAALLAATVGIASALLWGWGSN
ncbi:DUF1232 domain-containing protein [Acanthopleuribacter pedis]|uniref:DUF1232 domain-containing protein n=1 Tax=Acanthopleuribacter pedis TaxID=442870 RepID=A0A8J7QDI7_9BACT|nr:DUF1232 domain-containing protein [Acanthopleuribacter pedis]MBO1317615.1 DUF1232 domain-containing protein [Acanthopleuribacter pedis]